MRCLCPAPAAVDPGRRCGPYYSPAPALPGARRRATVDRECGGCRCEVYAVQPSGIQRFSPAFVALAGLFVTCLIVANIIAVKFLALPFGLAVPAGVVIFPLSYLFGDVLTEVYGYAAARRVIWLGFFCNLLAVVAIAIVGALPGAVAAGWSVSQQSAYESILGFTPVLLFASFCAYLAGEFLNAFVLAK